MSADRSNCFSLQSFGGGVATRAYEYFGVHREGNELVFRVWAPHAQYVSVCGDFTNWQTDRLPMTRRSGGDGSIGVWELHLSADTVRAGDRYKYFIRNGCRELYKADPYGVFCESAYEGASVLYDIDGYQWRDGGWMTYRSTRYTREAAMQQPINVYELHAGSWKRHDDGSLYSYRELAAELVTYVKQMGYTHVELMPILEHPFDGSWGYQVTGFYAATSRYGEPKDLMALVDTLHEAGIGVILDWVPAHFPKDAHGLYEFDGQPLYEYASPERMGNPVWGTRYFNLERGEVQSFLLSNLFFWIEKFHVDGFRADAISSMLYLDYDRWGGEWLPNRYGDNRNLCAIDFFRMLNRAVTQAHPDVMMIAEESGEWQGVTDVDDGGLGFCMQWNMQWQKESLAYLAEDPHFRRERHAALRAQADAAHRARYVLPISHDEVVHGKRSLLGRAVGDYAQKFASVRTYLTYMMTHPGKKLSFMGNEIGPFSEWDHTRELEWSLLDYEMHARLQTFVAELNHLYLAQPTLWERDGDASGFEWIDTDDGEGGLLAYRRRDARGNELTAFFNFSAVEYNGFCLPMSKGGVYRELLNTDAERYGGRGRVNARELVAKPLEGGGTAILRIRIAPMSAGVLCRTDG